jgi:hypothetical protein
MISFDRLSCHLTLGGTLRIEFDDDAIRRVAGETARQNVQKVYDDVLDAGRGKTVDQVKALLICQWQATFGVPLADPELSRVAAALADGRRVKARVEAK